MSSDTFTVGDFALGPGGLTARVKKPTLKSFAQLIDYLSWQRRGGKWWCGDALNLAEATHGEEYAQLVGGLQAGTEWSDQTVRGMQWCCSRVPATRRRSDLSFRHHVEVAALPAAQQRTWLAKAATGDTEIVMNEQGEEQEIHTPWTVARMRAEMSTELRGGAEKLLYVLVSCSDAADQELFLAKMSKEGRESTAMTRSKPKEKPVARVKKAA